MANEQLDQWYENIARVEAESADIVRRELAVSDLCAVIELAGIEIQY